MEIINFGNKFLRIAMDCPFPSVLSSRLMATFVQGTLSVDIKMHQLRTKCKIQETEGTLVF